MQSNAAGAEGLSIRSDITWYDKLVTWWTFFQISINERLVYRGDFMLGTLMRFLPTMTQIFFWWAIYDVISTQSADGSLDGEIQGYRFGDMVAYNLMVIISRAFSSMPGLTSGIANQVLKRTGHSLRRSALRPRAQGQPHLQPTPSLHAAGRRRGSGWLRGPDARQGDRAASRGG